MANSFLPILLLRLIEDLYMSGKIVQLTMFPELEKESFEITVVESFKAVFAKTSILMKQVKSDKQRIEELETIVFSMQKRIANISEHYLEKTL